MASRFRGHCLDCGHEWHGLARRLDCGPIDFQTPATYRCYSCARCCVDLYVPRRLSRSSWLRWVTENASELTRSPLLFRACELGVRVDVQALGVISRSPLLSRACERVSCILAGMRSRYEPAPIDIGTIECPDCGDELAIGCLETSFLVCPDCESQSARAIGEQHPELVLVDYTPLEDDEVRLVIRHLKELAGYHEGHHSTRKLALPTSDGRALLWDRELDG